MDDDVLALDGSLQAGGIRQVAFGRLSWQLARAGRVADQRSNLVPLVVNCANDVRPDEAGAAGDEDLQTDSRSKFCQ